MKSIRSFKKYNESLGRDSKSSLSNLKDDLQFVIEYDVEPSEAIEVIDEIINMEWEQIEELSQSILTNKNKSAKDNFTLRLIDRYCSPY